MRATTIPLLLLGVALAGCTTSEDASDEVLGRAATFDDASITVSVGDTVTFRMAEGSHTVDFSEGTDAVAGVSDAHSGNLDEGNTFTVTFTEPGTYPYFCRYHSSLSGGERVGMVGTITVT